MRELGFLRQTGVGSVAASPPDPLYPTLARTLALRRDNLSVTVADLEKRLVAVTHAIRASISEAA